MPTHPRPRLSLKARALGWLAQREHSRAELRRKLLRAARQEAAQRQAELLPAGSPPAESGQAVAGEPEERRPPPSVHPDDDPRHAAATRRGAGEAAPRPLVLLSPPQAGVHHVSGAPVAEPALAADCADPERCVDRLLDWLQAHHYLSEARFVESRVHARAARYGNLRIRQELAQHGVTADEVTLQQLRDSELERARAVWRRKFDQPPADAHERARQMRFLAQRGFSAEVVRRVVQDGDDD